jgi:acyl carrier protein
MEDKKLAIKSFLSRFLNMENLRDDDDFFALGLVNSLFAMQLVAFMEKEFCIVIEDEDLDVENFNSVNALIRFAERKSAEGVSSAG